MEIDLLKIEDSYPKSGLFNSNEEINNIIEKVNYKELLLEGLSPEFLKLFQDNLNLFYSQNFLEGISYEYGLFGKSKNIKKAFKIYQEAADFKYDYLCMYRMHRIFSTDYKDFGIKKNEDLHRLYLYKCFAYLPSLIIQRIYFILNKIDITYELVLLLDYNENGYLNLLEQFMDFLNLHKEQFNITSNDIKLMTLFFKRFFDQMNTSVIEKDINCIDCFLEFEKGDTAYFEAKLKYCYFYLEYSGEKCDKNKIKDIFDDLMKDGYYKACCDYGRFLVGEKKMEEAKKMFHIGYNNNQQFCQSDYIYLVMTLTSFNQIISDYNTISYILKNMCLTIAFERLGQSSFYYQVYYLIKHTKFKENIEKDFGKYVKEIFETEKSYFQNKKVGYINDVFAEKYMIQIPRALGVMYYYGISNIIKSDKDTALIYFRKAYQLAKEKEYNYDKRYNYLYIYKCRKYLLKNNKITVTKLNKTKEKLLRFYEESDLNSLTKHELYNYYKLYKIGVNENTQKKLISILKLGKSPGLLFHFKNYVSREKCRIALELEYSINSSSNLNTSIISRQNDKNNINIFFKTMENKQYKLRISKSLQFIIAIHYLYTNYPELESKKIGTYVCNGNKICIFDTIEENGLKEGNTILIINKVN